MATDALQYGRGLGFGRGNATLETAIDEVGRERVFNRAQELGWGRQDAPPEWTWWGIVNEFRRKNRSQL
jgi:hypothetical protein